MSATSRDAGSHCGEQGRDQIGGGKGADRIDGGKGADRIDGGTDNDTATGGSGWDDFIFDRGDGRDTITDLDGRTDRIEIGRGADDFIDIGLRKSGDDIIVTFDDVRITLTDVRLSEITATDFLFV